MLLQEVQHRLLLAVYPMYTLLLQDLQVAQDQTPPLQLVIHTHILKILILFQEIKPLIHFISNNAIDYAELDDHVFVHGWIPCLKYEEGIDLFGDYIYSYNSVPDWKVGNWEDAKRELLVLIEMFPDRTDDRNREASNKLIDIEKRMQKKGVR